MHNRIESAVSSGRGMRFLLLVLGVSALLAGSAFAQEAEECLACHSDHDLTGSRKGKTFSVFVDQKKFAASVHGSLPCVACHADLAGKELPHEPGVQPAVCADCHDQVAKLQAKSLHGQAAARGDALAPRCPTCHGNHAIVSIKDPRSPVSPLQIPFTCGKCHSEGSPVQRERQIHQDHIIENYTESIHGEGLLKKGLIVSATCASCHTAHSQLPHTDPNSSIARKNIAATCTKCHAQIESVHRKVIKGELWEREAHVLPACVDCHQPHKARKVFYDQGMADKDCLRCHGRKDLVAAKDGRSLYVAQEHLGESRHVRVACSQCHSGVNVAKVRPCETITQPVDCGSCHVEVAQQYVKSTHGQLIARQDPNGPSCKDCHGTHRIFGKYQPQSPTFPTNVPELCGRCHREGEKAAVRYKGDQTNIVQHYNESIHGKGLSKSGLTVTAMCTSCHTAHGVLPRKDPLSSINQANVPATCGKCHHGIEEQFRQSIHADSSKAQGKKLPVCDDCHSAHAIRRADEEGFKLNIMNQCGRCHEEIARTYFDTYHGKVSQLGYTGTAKCYDCHGSHDIMGIGDPRSHLSRENVVATCQKCHAGANRRFAGYLTHATHHDPAKYPWLFWTFWGMTGLLIVTFVIGGIHTLLWLPRALQMRRARTKRDAARMKEAASDTTNRDHGPA